ncbi:MAG: DEAD/DEAH box helicase family protein [Candidatus Latescibacterota bacterium]
MTDATLNHRSAPSAKITLFRQLFRGREDVYPRRFESRRTGKSGYQPACANEWVRGLCDKRATRCAECPHRRFLTVTDEVVRCHLSGCDQAGRPFVMGVYPMLQDETCFLLAVDMDKEGWAEDASALQATCRQLGLPAALERSRSGQGAHLWLFFAEAVPAATARALGAHLLTETMELRPEVGLDSYDRLFPDQDTRPAGGFGSLIALPLQKQAREAGNSVFVDDQLVPYPDQWEFLASVPRIPLDQARALARQAERRGRVVGAVRLPLDDEDAESPWAALPSRRPKEPPLTGLPQSLELILADQIYVARQGLPPGLRNRLLRLAAFQNPEFYKAQARHQSTYGTPRLIACAEELPQHLALPRGCLEEVCDLLTQLRVTPVLRDERSPGTPLHLSFQGELRPEQQAAAQALAAHDLGVLSAGTAFGKTVVAAWLIARRGVNTLVLVHRQQLQEQWVERLSAFLGLPARQIGRIGGGRRKPTGSLDVALIQSLVRRGVVDDGVAAYGHLVVDECHRLPAPSFAQVARRTKARYVTGLSATVVRQDGHHPIVFMQCGPVRHRADPRTEARQRPFTHTVWVRPTGFRPVAPAAPDVRSQFTQVCGELLADEARNQLLCDDVVQAVRQGRSPLVLTERTAHLDLLAQRLSPSVQHLIVLRGGMGRKALAAVRAELAATPDDEERVLLATGRYLGEGFDDARLDTLFLALPVSWRGTIAQYAGRLHRLHDRKREARVYDYADLDVPLLARMLDRRCRGYEALGYTILQPASAVPGWPAEAPLPVDRVWKETYAASVRRLLRNGLDGPLATLFSQVARPVPAGAEGAARARSATEAFVYRRLESLPETAGRFRLNAELPIPFDGRGRMEVDLLDEAARLVVELDGAQHLGDPDAYRRDRRKDRLLQEHGYVVLRFLAEDVGPHLDELLDAILRAQAGRGQSA